MKRTPAILALEDGKIFNGYCFGASTTKTGEICFNTSMTGYQEILTDPSYRNQIIIMTYPLIGNYGINLEDSQSSSIHASGMVVEESCDEPSSWRSQKSLSEFLSENGTPGIQGIDTRSLTKHIREKGVMRATITSDPKITSKKAIELSKKSNEIKGSDLVKEVTTSKSYIWDKGSIDSKEWNFSERKTLPDATVKLIAYDFGIKYDILKCLRQEGFEVEVVPSTTPASVVLDSNPDAVFLSNGPGDPSSLGYIHDEIKKLIFKKPILGICLGHQIIAHCLGAKTFKMKFGHRGGNHPVKDIRNNRVMITSQNHGFAIDEKSLPNEVIITHINLNDSTIEGLSHKNYPIFSVQHHPEAGPGPNDSKSTFKEFKNLILSI